LHVDPIFPRGVLALLLVVSTPAIGFAQPASRSPTDAAAALIKAYPDFLDRIQ